MEGLLKQYAWLFNLGVVVGLAYFVAKITNIYVASLLEVPRSIAVVSQGEPEALERVVGTLGEYDIIVARNIFDASQTPEPEPCQPGDERPECAVDDVPSPTGEAVKTALRIKVLATLMVGEGRDDRSSATIDAGSGKGVDVFAVADREKTFAPGVVLLQVKPRRIEFVNSGRLEYAELEEELGPSIFVRPDEVAGGKTASQAIPQSEAGVPTGDQVRQVGESKFVVNQAEIDAALGNLDRLYTEIRAVPNFKEGKVQGMKILSIRPGSLFAKLGLRRGDVLDQINGQPIDIKRGFELFNQLKEQRQFTLNLERQGQSTSLEYEVR